MTLKDKIAVVLGASAEGGCGWAIAEAFAKQGARVSVAARSMEGIQRLAERIGGIAIRCDASQPEDIARLAALTTERLGRPDIAVNCAGLPIMGDIATLPGAELQRSLDVNFIAMVHFIREMTARMNDNGSIILLSSFTSVRPQLPHFAYACAKAATDCLVRYAALEFGSRGIRINSILPGLIKTALTSGLIDVPGVVEAFAREVPLGRVGEIEDYADAALWLAGGAFVTGLNLEVNGGIQLTRLPQPHELSLGEESYGSGYT